IPINPESGNIEATTIEAQTEQVIRNLKSVLVAAGSDLTKVLKCTVYLVDLQEFTRFNSVYGSFFADLPPARSTVQVAKLPRDSKIEIDVIAYRLG
ncbi:MAG: Rid family detoxifying hydrolase, partial [Rhabdochlamydiaceae bacterium]